MAIVQPGFACAQLASYRKLTARLNSVWPSFLAARKERLRQQERMGEVAEKLAENIVEDLLTQALDWLPGDLNYQLDYADIVVTRLGLKQMLLEIKRPGALSWNQNAVTAALVQAHRYAAGQKVLTVGVSDGQMLYVEEVAHGGSQPRLFVALDQADPPSDLWWIAQDGIWRHREGVSLGWNPLEREAAGQSTVVAEGGLLHPTYRLPACCFAYVGDASKPRTWHLPYLRADLNVDSRRLPKAIQALVSNYRGARLANSSIPDQAVPSTLLRLAHAAAQTGHWPINATSADAYLRLDEHLKQLDLVDRVNEVN
jgi:hypothetical protein